MIKLSTWDYAIQKGGFYFQRCRYLGLSRPPLFMVDELPVELMTSIQLDVEVAYYMAFNDAEIEASINAKGYD